MTAFPKIEFQDDEGDIQRATYYLSALAGGPNSGLELPDVLKDGSLANEFPEMKEDMDLIISTESHVRRLQDLQSRIHERSGINRSMGMELLELVPDMQSFHEGSFTTDISSINAQPSLEAINGRLAAIIAAGIAIVVGLIWKLISWIMGRRGSSASTPSSSDLKLGSKEAVKVIEEKRVGTKKAMDSIEETESILNETKNIVLDIPFPRNITQKDIVGMGFDKKYADRLISSIEDLKRTKDARPPAVPVMSNVYLFDIINAALARDGNRGTYKGVSIPLMYFERHIDDLFEKPNPFINDCMGDGKLTKLMHKAVDMLPSVVARLNENTRLLFECSNMLMRPNFDKKEVQRRIVENFRAMKGFDGLSFGGKKMTALEVSDLLQAEIVKKTKEGPKQKFDIYELLIKARVEMNAFPSDDFYIEARTFLENSAVVFNAFDEIKIDIKSLLDSGEVDGDFSLSVDKLYQQALMQLANGFQVVATIHNYLHDFASTSVKLSNAVLVGLKSTAEMYVVNQMEIPQPLSNLLRDTTKVSANLANYFMRFKTQ